MWRKTSERSLDYNCIAWALDINDQWLWPSDPWAWPRPKPSVVTVDEFVEVFRMFGYEQCATELVEPGFEKIALYVKDGEPTHAARQTSYGWTSKLSDWIDIHHDQLSDFPTKPIPVLAAYGGAALFFKRSRRHRYNLFNRLVMALRLRRGY